MELRFRSSLLQLEERNATELWKLPSSISSKRSLQLRRVVPTYEEVVPDTPSSSGVGGLRLLSGSKLALMVFFYFSLPLLLRRKTWSLSFTAFFHLPFFLLQYIFYQQTITTVTRRSDVLSTCLQSCWVRLWICSSLFPPHATTPHPQT